MIVEVLITREQRGSHYSCGRGKFIAWADSDSDPDLSTRPVPRSAKRTQCKICLGGGGEGKSALLFN